MLGRQCQAPGLAAAALLLQQRKQYDDRLAQGKIKAVSTQPCYLNGAPQKAEPTRQQHKSPTSGMSMAAGEMGEAAQLQDPCKGSWLVSAVTAGSDSQQARCSSAPPARRNSGSSPRLDTEDVKWVDACNSTPIQLGILPNKHGSGGNIKSTGAWRALWPSPGVPGWTRVWSSDSEWDPPTPPPDFVLPHLEEVSTLEAAAQSLKMVAVLHGKGYLRRGAQGPAFATLHRTQLKQGMGSDFRSSGGGAAQGGVGLGRLPAPPVRGTGPAAQGTSRVLSPIRV